MKSVTGILLAALATVDRSVVALELETSDKLPSVPLVQNPDKNGFPTIKSIQSVMDGYTREKDALNHDAAVLGLHLKKLEKEDADRIAQQSEVYLEKLREQEKKNQVVSGENAKIAKFIMQVRKGSDKLSALVQNEQKKIELRRSQFATLRQKILDGQERVSDLLEGGDASMGMAQTGDETARKEEQAPMSFLEIVQEGARRQMARKHVDDVAEDLDLSQLSSSDSFTPVEGHYVDMDITSSKPQVTPAIGEIVEKQEEQISADISEIPADSLSRAQTGLTELEGETGTQISTLASQASKLSQATGRSLAELKASFQEGYKAGAKRHNALMEQQSVLKANLKSAEEQLAKLKATYKRLMEVRQGLDHELQKHSAVIGGFERMVALQLSATPREQAESEQ